jgi:hypothetical protein
VLEVDIVSSFDIEMTKLRLDAVIYVKVCCISSIKAIGQLVAPYA